MQSDLKYRCKWKTVVQRCNNCQGNGVLNRGQACNICGGQGQIDAKIEERSSSLDRTELRLTRSNSELVTDSLKL